MKKEELQTKIRNLAQLRHSLELNKQALARLIAELENNPAYKLAKDSCEILKISILAAETDLRSGNVAYYSETNEKHVFPELGIRNVTILEYDLKKAIEYCEVNLKAAITIDTAMFEGVAKKTDLDFVTKKQEPQGTIATDLSSWLEAK